MSLIHMPGNLGIKMRYILYKPFFKSCGKKVYIDAGVHLSGMKHMRFGNNIHIDKNCILQAGNTTVGHQKIIENANYAYSAGELVIGDHVHVVHSCMLFAFGGIQIDNNCTLSAGTKLYSQSNLPYNPEDKSEVVSIMPYQQAHFIQGPICLQQNVWLGLNCTVMPGTTIGANSFAVSYSLIKGDFLENSYLQGAPAVKIRNRFEKT